MVVNAHLTDEDVWEQRGSVHTDFSQLFATICSLVTTERFRATTRIVSESLFRQFNTPGTKDAVDPTLFKRMYV